MEVSAALVAILAVGIALARLILPGQRELRCDVADLRERMLAGAEGVGFGPKAASGDWQVSLPSVRRQAGHAGQKLVAIVALQNPVAHPV